MRSECKRVASLREIALNSCVKRTMHRDGDDRRTKFGSTIKAFGRQKSWHKQCISESGRTICSTVNTSTIRKSAPFANKKYDDDVVRCGIAT